MACFLSGEVPIPLSTTGFASDPLVSARSTTAKEDLIDVDVTTHPDLLYGNRGAGHHFGLVTQLVVKTFPLMDSGNDKGLIWGGSFDFPIMSARR